MSKSQSRIWTSLNASLKRLPSTAVPSQSQHYHHAQAQLPSTTNNLPSSSTSAHPVSSTSRRTKSMATNAINPPSLNIISPPPLPPLTPPPRPLTTKLRRPIPNSYWVTPFLIACEYPWCPPRTTTSTPPGPSNSSRPSQLSSECATKAQKLDALLLAGVSTFIDLTQPDELRPYDTLLHTRARALGLPPSRLSQISYHRFPIPDRCLPNSPSLVPSILSLLQSSQAQGLTAAIHCRGGIGRTGTIVGCWLIQSGIARDGDEALRMIAEEWKTVEKHVRFPVSPETGPQVEFVRNFKRIALPLLSSPTSNSTGIAGVSSREGPSGGPSPGIASW